MHVHRTYTHNTYMYEPEAQRLPLNCRWPTGDARGFTARFYFSLALGEPWMASPMASPKLQLPH